MNPQDTLDQDVVTLAKAIRAKESGGNFNARGASGEFGAYQYMPDTWKGGAQKYLGDSNAQPTPENQNKVAYSQIKEWKDQGYNPGQIASMWNSGKPDPTGNVGVNSKGVKYDTPSYVQGVYGEYQKLKQTQPQVQPQVSSQVEPVQEQPQQTGMQKTAGFFDTIFGGGKIGEAIGTGIAQGKFGSGIQKFVTGQDLSPEAEKLVAPGPSAKEVIGDVGRVALNFTPYGKATGALATRLGAEGLKKTAKPLANIAVGAGTGYGLDVAENARQGEQNIFKPGAGTLVGGGLGALGAGTGAGLRKLASNTGDKRLADLTSNYVKPSTILKEQTRNVGTKEAPKLRSPLDVIKEEKLMPEVVNSKTDTSKMVEALESRLEEAAGATRTALKNSGVVVPFSKFKKDIIEAIMADETIRNLGQTDAALKQVGSILKSYQKSYGREVPITIIDDIRQTMNKNKWRPEAHDIYRAIGDAARKVVYKAVPDEKIKKMLQREGELIGARDLAEALNARAVKSGLIGKHFETLVGGLAGMGAGAIAGPLGMGAGALTGALATRKIGDIARGMYFKTPVSNVAQKAVNVLDSGVLTPGDRLLRTKQQ